MRKSMLALLWFVCLIAPKLASAECDPGWVQCGVNYCSPAGEVCCASVGREDLYCPAGAYCTADGRCQEPDAYNDPCGAGSVDCGDGTCCPSDYPICAADGMCDQTHWEGGSSCPASYPVDCGNGFCCDTGHPICLAGGLCQATGGGSGPQGMNPGPSGDGGNDGVCTNTCELSHDDLCDDGGPGSDYSDCAFGTDCADCGARDESDRPTDSTSPAELFDLGCAVGASQSRVPYEVLAAALMLWALGVLRTRSAGSRHRNVASIALLVMGPAASPILTSCGGDDAVRTGADAEAWLTSHIILPGEGDTLSNPALDDSIATGGGGEGGGTLEPGDTGTVSIPFNAPNGNVIGAGIRFGDSGPIRTVPIAGALGQTSGTLQFDFQVPLTMCANLSNICHDIKCYEFAVTDAGTVSQANITTVAALCGGCDEPSCQGLLTNCEEETPFDMHCTPVQQACAGVTLESCADSDRNCWYRVSGQEFFCGYCSTENLEPCAERTVDAMYALCN